MLQNPYLALTEEFNEGSLRVLLSSGQAVVVHKLAVMSKDGAWIVRETPDVLGHVLRVLERHGATYRFGAPLDARWLAGGWSSHFEYRSERLRIRTDFVTRPPRIAPTELQSMWARAERERDPVIALVPLAAIKLTDREKDYAVVGELARAMPEPLDQIRFSRSAKDLIALSERYPDLVAKVRQVRPALDGIAGGREALEEALDKERRSLMRVNEARLAGYQRSGKAWAGGWTRLAESMARLPLRDAHALMVERALGVLPFGPDGTSP